ncbi:hypothetical protein [Mycoplana ramosa]|uniref:Uncharacterized protein n=1 Tax=Mycoplana ramosa TaxID=40837 RepID=A0ABW3YSY6_MYCRA
MTTNEQQHGRSGDVAVKGSEVSAETVQACVKDILASRVFSRSGRLRAFLEYVVERQLAGKAGQLKGYTIGIDVFGRPTGFDSGSDPIVRVQAGKLRKLLEEYYAGEGANAPLRIRIPRGSYVPEYEMMAAGSGGAAKPAPVNVASERTRKRRPWWHGRQPAPVSSHLALLTLLPLFVLAPATAPKTALTSMAGASFSIEASPDHGTTLPSLRIESCPDGGGNCRRFAAAIANAAGYYRTVRLAPELAHGQPGPLFYTLRLEAGSKNDAVFARLVHDESGATIHAEHFPARELDDKVGATYEAVSYAGRILSANGRIYQHAAQLGTVTSLMTCLRETDRLRASGGVADSCPPSPHLDSSTAPLAPASRIGNLRQEYGATSDSARADNQTRSRMHPKI